MSRVKMPIGSGRQAKKDAKGASSASHQLSGQRQKELLPPAMRSPALESLERGKSGRAGRQLHRPAKRPAAPGRKMRYAAEESLARPALPRKSLQRHAGNHACTLSSMAALLACWYGRYSAHAGDSFEVWSYRLRCITLAGL